MNSNFHDHVYCCQSMIFVVHKTKQFPSMYVCSAAADEKLKGEAPSASSTSLHDSLAFSQAIQDIEKSSFAAISFKSSRGVNILSNHFYLLDISFPVFRG